MIAPALAPATLTQRRTGLSGCSANPHSAPASAIPFTPPPRKTPSASSIHSMAAILSHRRTAVERADGMAAARARAGACPVISALSVGGR
jgi:hypothetical protein